MLGPGGGTGGSDPRPFGLEPFEGAGELRPFSPNGTRLPVVQDGVLWLLAYPGGAAIRTPITGLPFQGWAGWMPDSRHIAMEEQASRFGFAMVDTHTLTSRTILRSPTPLMTPSVSPDGKRLAFGIGDDRWRLVEVTVADGRVREIGSGSRLPWFPSVSPDGTRLAFADAERMQIRETLLGSSDDRRSRVIATDTDTLLLTQVEWAPDGTRVLYTASTDIGGRGRLMVMVAPAGGGRALPVDPDADESRDGVWSPDGTRIVYRRRIGGEHQIVALRVGTSAAPVVAKRWSAQDEATSTRVPVAWSPDGRWLLTRLGLNLFLMTPDGSQERQLSSAVMPFYRARAIFSRDGREVLTLRRDASAPGRPLTLIGVDIASGRERVLTTAPLPVSADDVAGLSLSPDGTRFYTSFADWPFDIWMLEGFR